MARGLSDDDILVWRAVARTARPLPGRTVPQSKADAPKPGPAPKRVTSKLSAAPPPPAPPKAPDPATHRPAPTEMSGERRIRRGKVEVDGKLDLHGMTQIQAHAALARFLAHHRAEGARVVLVVTGKGKKGEGVIRAAIPAWLRELSDIVSGYAPAHARHGGTGALYVRLRRPN